MPHRLIVNGDLVLYGFVGMPSWLDDSGFTSREVIEALAEFDGDVTVRINSPGGIATEGSAIYAALAAHDGVVTAVVEGVAASAASIIAMAGDEIVMAGGALMMIHDPSGITFGTAEDHRATAATLDVLAGAMARIYAKRAGITAAVARQIMQVETWFDGPEAVKQGFATRAETETDATATVPVFDYRSFKHAPAPLVARVDGWRSEGKRLAAVGKFTASAEPAAPRLPIVSPQSTEAGMPAIELKDLTLATLREQRADLVNELLASADVKAMLASAAKHERERITGIQSAMFPGQEALAAQLIADGSTSVGDAALAFNKAERAKGGQQLAAIEAMDKQVQVPAAPTVQQPGGQATAATPDEWKAEYQKSAELKAEFGSEAAYVAYQEGVASGRIRILTSRKA